MCTRYLRLAFCILVLTSVMVLWTLLYWPWSAFSWRTIGSSAYVSYAANLMLGLVIALGNAIVGQTIVMLTDYFDFRYQNRAHMVYLLAIVPCVFINIFADLYVTMGTAMAVYNAHNATNVSWISYNGLRLVMSDLFDLLVPGYILLPYMGEPMMTVLLPYWISIWRVKRDTRITAEHSERLMEAPPADIINPPYCDIICATSTFMLTFLAPSSTHWKLYLALLFFAVFVYLINRVRILRWQSAAQFNTSDLHIAESYLWALPLALLAAVFGSHIGPQDRSGSIGAGVLAFILHCVFHFIFVRWVVPWSCGRSEKKNSARSYNELIGKLSAAATYRNTNPIEVLKNHSSEGSGSLVFFRPGKEYLQTDSSKNYMNDEPAMRYTHGLQQVATHAAQQAAHAAQHAAAATGQGFSSAAVATGKGFSTGVHAAQHAAAATGGAISKNRTGAGSASVVFVL
ncbi:unnamed protein product [Polarella glacialis]|uniref:Uncharacterized protein n=1 Tax=Polarella glacialis TaxID=89957 RepID=A0A813JZ26_POLGL|nr:unnamed protein product [Polarella glacialis]